MPGRDMTERERREGWERSEHKQTDIAPGVKLGDVSAHKKLFMVKR